MVFFGVIVSLLLLKLSVFSGNSFFFGLYYSFILTIFLSLNAENFSIFSSSVLFVCMFIMAIFFISSYKKAWINYWGLYL